MNKMLVLGDVTGCFVEYNSELCGGFAIVLEVRLENAGI